MNVFHAAMQKEFEKILVLIDHSPASIHAAEEASQLAAKFESELHILQIIPSVSLVYSFLHPSQLSNDLSEKVNENSGSKELDELVSKIKNEFQIAVRTGSIKGNHINAVKKYTADKKIDLVIVAGKKQSQLKEIILKSTAEQLIHSIDCEVLCIYPETKFSKIKKLVIPIGKTIPKRKIRIAYELGRKFSANLHLIALAKNSQGLKVEEIKALMDTYRYIKDIMNIPVQCSTVIGNNIAEAAIRYAKNIKADLILINPETESRLKESLFYGWGSDITNHSPVPVLSVSPLMDKINRKGLQAS